MNEQLSKVLAALDEVGINHSYGIPHVDFITVLADPNPSERWEITVWYDGEALIESFIKRPVAGRANLDAVLAMIRSAPATA